MNYLIDWSFNAIDTIFSTKKAGGKEPYCPEGSYSSGYVRDAGGNWQPLCLSLLSLEDSEDVYILVCLVLGVSAIGAGLIYAVQKIKYWTTLEGAPRMPTMLFELGKAAGDEALKLDALSAKLDGITMRLDAMAVRQDAIAARLGNATR